jgi:hypothetical protein
MKSENFAVSLRKQKRQQIINGKRGRLTNMSESGIGASYSNKDGKNQY